MNLSDRINDTNAAPWVIEEIKKLEAERDELRKLAYIGEHLHEDCSWKFRFSELKAERDALAAHLERIIREWISGDDKFSDEWINRMGDIVEDAPETNLSRLKAQWQAKPTRQYFYRVSGCKALSSDSDQCICWHDEGEGPLAEGSAKHWRGTPIKPAEQHPAPDVSALVEALQTACEYLPIGSRALELASIALATPVVQEEPVAITDADILAIAGRVESCPVPPWWLKDDVANGDIQAAVLRFARALLVAAYRKGGEK